MPKKPSVKSSDLSLMSIPAFWPMADCGGRREISVYRDLLHRHVSAMNVGAGKSASASALNSHCDSGPASSPIPA